MGNEDTIVAISTPPGRGGIGIVRLSGARSLEIVSPLLRMRQSPGHAQAQFAELVDVADPGRDASQRLDEVVITYFQSPHSYTREDVLEIAAHGSPVILDFLVRACVERGARLARPGEFTERAFLSGRIDLTQAEAVRDLIDAQTLYQAKIASEQMGGALSRRIAPVKQALVHLIAELEAGIDFAEDDIDLLPAPTIAGRIADIAGPLHALAAGFVYGRIVRNGFTLAIVGRPNAGKSSLFNRLVQRERAIVTSAPGTTRDLVTETIALGGIPLHLIDTAGLREAENEAESIGIEKSREAFADADVIVLVLDATADVLTTEELAMLESLPERRALIAINKTDLPQGSSAMQRFQQQGKNVAPLVSTSALTGEGIPALQNGILKLIRADARETEHGLMTNLRQQQAVASALGALQDAESALATDIPHEMLLLDLYSALRHLDALTGATTAEDVLNLIFSTFCIGK
ncbi:MAG TPA: tRNA uridine-5-carboxymethylaminomethyl(34) synthesis GTPase MnmE [Acidobacteriaceae bacterium]|nr:tRNA uridine-5-carboxymethylaminomethyl(34) synthesis GTPase MnmE [Acidobacteriaceae bacterium]